MFTISGNVSLLLAAQSALEHDLGVAVDRMSLAYNYPLVDRSGTFGGNAVYADKAQLAAGFDKDYRFNVALGDLETIEGNLLRFDKVYAWCVNNRSTAALITLQGDFSILTGVTQVKVESKGFILQTMPQGVTLGEAILRIDNPGPGTADFDIVIIGTLNND